MSANEYFANICHVYFAISTLFLLLFLTVGRHFFFDVFFSPHFPVRIAPILCCFFFWLILPFYLYASISLVDSVGGGKTTTANAAAVE